MILKKWEDLPIEFKTDEVKHYYDILAKRKFSLLLKRIFDIVVSFIMLTIALPFFIILAILIKIDSKGPVFYRQERVTRYNTKFKIFKFRTMIQINMPLALNIFYTIFLWRFINYWNDYNTPMLYLPTKPTLAYAIYYVTERMTGAAVNLEPRKTAILMLFADLNVYFLLIVKFQITDKVRAIKYDQPYSLPTSLIINSLSKVNDAT